MEAKARILVVDDDPVVQRSCRRILEPAHEVSQALTGQEALSLLAQGRFDLALVDLKLPDLSGMDILRQQPNLFPDTLVVMITGFSTVSCAVEAIKLGAFDYLPKPFSPEELELAVEKAFRQRRLRHDYRRLQEALSDQYRLRRLIGQSEAMKRVFSLIQAVAETDSTVLLSGESGTGKELAARAIHFSSRRRDKPFVAVDCGAIAANLIASELFGHVRGAFTGADHDHGGLIQAADGGTLLLDEINNLPPDPQASLLRVIEAREVRAVGAPSSVQVDVRYIASTNRNLKELVEQGKFREDLFYRFNVFPIHLPPLRERREDIPVLARHFLAEFSARMHKPVSDFTPEALEAFTRYDWPGNVRELSNVVERLVILCPGGAIGQAHFQETIASATVGWNVPQTADELNQMRHHIRDRSVVDIEKAFLLEALKRNDYNVTRSAEQTGMQRSNFQALLKKHNLRIKDQLPRANNE